MELVMNKQEVIDKMNRAHRLYRACVSEVVDHPELIFSLDRIRRIEKYYSNLWTNSESVRYFSKSAFTKFRPDFAPQIGVTIIDITPSMGVTFSGCDIGSIKNSSQS